MSTRAALLSAAASLVSAAPLPIDDRLVPQCTQISPLLTGPGTTVGTCGHPSLPCPSGSDIDFKLCKDRCVTIDPLNDESVSGNLEYNEHTAKCTLVYTSQEAEADGRRMLQGAGAGDHAVCQKQVGPSSYCQGTVCHGSTVPCGGGGGPSPPSGTASGTLWLFPKAEGYTTEDLASAADGFSSVACLALSNKDCSAVTSQAAIDQWKSCEQSFGAKSQRWLLVNNDCARKWSNVEAGVAALTGLANSAGGGVVGLAYNPEGGDKHMIQTAIESIPNMKLAYSMGPSPSAGCPAAPQCSPTSRWTLLGQMYTLGADGLCRCFQRSTAGEKAECLASWEKEKYGPFAANSVGMFCVKTANTDLGECNETRQCGAIEGQGPHIEEFFAPNALKSVMPVLKGTSTSQDVALYLPQY